MTLFTKNKEDSKLLVLNLRVTLNRKLNCIDRIVCYIDMHCHNIFSFTKHSIYLHILKFFQSDRDVAISAYIFHV